MRYLLIAGLIAGLAGDASAWGGKGHRLIASLAEKRLKATHPAVVQRIAAILGPDVSLASIASCADSIRDYVAGKDKPGVTLPGNCFVTEKEALAMFPRTGSWHFVNIPVPASANPFAHPKSVLRQACAAAAPCITTQIEYFTAQLKNKHLDKKTRAIALMFLVHLVGDIHQPLHAVERNKDRGGNEVFVSLGSQTGRLHRLWDSFFVEPLEEVDVEGVAPLFGGKPDTWAWESYDAARQTVYANIPIEPSTLETPIKLRDPDYRNAAVPVVKKRLRTASLRLAELLAKTLRS
jgi:hypothetical protein